MQRWAAGVEYVGSRYSGWQSQTEAPSLQAEVQRALSTIADQPVHIVTAGRTDAGVHALNQVIHFDSGARRAPHAWLFGGNTLLPRDVSLRWVQPVAPEFHARHSAVARRYRYVMRSARSRSALLEERAAWLIGAPLDAPRMHRAAQALVGEHDFSAYRDSDCQSATPMRRMHALGVTAHGEFTVLDVQGNAFLHHMVRNIAGVLIAIGQGDKPETWAAEVLASRQRTRGGVTAPPEGLYFIGPSYPEHFGLPPPAEPWFPGLPWSLAA